MSSKEVCMGKEQGKKTQTARGLEEDGRKIKTTASVVMDNISQVGGESASMTMIAARDFFWGVERFLDTRRKFQASGLSTHTRTLSPFLTSPSPSLFLLATPSTLEITQLRTSSFILPRSTRRRMN